MNTEYTFDADIVSDLHKDAFGFRPKGDYWAWWDSCTDAEKQVEWDHLIEACNRAAQEEQEQEKICIGRFEELVAKTIDSGAKDRETALRWIMDASTCNGDWEFLCYHHGLPYGYFRASK